MPWGELDRWRSMLWNTSWRLGFLDVLGIDGARAPELEDCPLTARSIAVLRQFTCLEGTGLAVDELRTALPVCRIAT